MLHICFSSTHKTCSVVFHCSPPNIFTFAKKYPFSKIYLSRSPKPIPWGKSPIISSLYGHRNTHQFYSKMAKTFDLLGFSRQKADCFHMITKREHIHRLYFPHCVFMLYQVFQISCECLRIAGYVHDLFRRQLYNR